LGIFLSKITKSGAGADHPDEGIRHRAPEDIRDPRQRFDE
jgi:hypothetical protein